MHACLHLLIYAGGPAIPQGYPDHSCVQDILCPSLSLDDLGDRLPWTRSGPQGSCHPWLWQYWRLFYLCALSIGEKITLILSFLHIPRLSNKYACRICQVLLYLKQIKWDTNVKSRCDDYNIATKHQSEAC